MTYNESSVLMSLSRKKDIKVDPIQRDIKILNASASSKNNDLGNGSWGKIDYLTNYLGYHISWVDKFLKP